MAKGLLDIYDKTCQDLGNENFIDWELSPGAGLVPGMICNAIAWYGKTDRWYLEEHDLRHLDEANSTWFARPIGVSPPEPSANIMKYFKLESGERLVTTNGKERPVILLRKEIDDWWNPANTATHVHSWLCLPLFSYKDRHSQQYVLNDQRLRNPNSFYIPACNGGPGISQESSARFQSVQMVNERHLRQLKSFCPRPEINMSKPIRLSTTGLRILLYHFYSGLSILEALEDPEAEYTLFREQIDLIISTALAQPVPSTLPGGRPNPSS